MAGEPLYPTEASSSESLASSGPSLSSGAFITNSQNFTIAGGHFTNVIQYASTIPSDFRTIPLGDLDLRNEIRLEESGMVSRQHGVCAARRIYTARIEGKPSDMTVAIYQGERAEENWKCELSKYSGFRHPNFVQLYGTVNSGGLYATIFHDDLVPVKQFIEEHRKSVVSTVYLYSYFNTQLSDANEYFQRGSPYSICEMSISWIRRSTGQLSVEIAPGHIDSYWKTLLYSSPQSLISPTSLQPDPETSIISRLTLDQFHEHCGFHLARTRRLTLYKIQVGAVISLHGESIQEIACTPNLTVRHWGWEGVLCERPTDMKNGWSRIHSSHVKGLMWRELAPAENSFTASWLSQANGVFSQFAIPLKHEDFLLVYGITYCLRFSGPLDNVPEGYLFLCPLQDVQSNDGRWLTTTTTEYPAYWSLDPSGRRRLRPEDAFRLGFPSFTFTLEAEVASWHPNVYAALSRFHAAKGLDPNSQDIARHLGHPSFLVARMSIMHISKKYLPIRRKPG